MTNLHAYFCVVIIGFGKGAKRFLRVCVRFWDWGKKILYGLCPVLGKGQKDNDSLGFVLGFENGASRFLIACVMFAERG